MEDVMTVYFNKRTGDVIQFTGTKNNMSMYGESAEDYSLIYDYIHVEKDGFVMDNFQDFKVVNGKLKYNLKDIPNKYL